jgi:hypothetical protein
MDLFSKFYRNTLARAAASFISLNDLAIIKHSLKGANPSEYLCNHLTYPPSIAVLTSITGPPAIPLPRSLHSLMLAPMGLLRRLMILDKRLWGCAWRRGVFGNG